MPNVNTYPTGNTFDFGISATETGLAIESIEETAATKKYEQPDGQGNIVNVATYDPRLTFTITAQTTATYSQAVGIAGAFASLFTLGGITSGLVLIDSIKLSKQRERNATVTIEGTRYPNIAQPAP